jgi:hypothetical protein
VTTPGANARNTFKVSCPAGDVFTPTRLSSIRTAVFNATSPGKLSKSQASTRVRAAASPHPRIGPPLTRSRSLCSAAPRRPE